MVYFQADNSQRITLNLHNDYTWTQKNWSDKSYGVKTIDAFTKRGLSAASVILVPYF